MGWGSSHPGGCRWAPVLGRTHCRVKVSGSLVWHQRGALPVATEQAKPESSPGPSWAGAEPQRDRASAKPGCFAKSDLLEAGPASRGGDTQAGSFRHWEDQGPMDSGGCRQGHACPLPGDMKRPLSEETSSGSPTPPPTPSLASVDSWSQSDKGCEDRCGSAAGLVQWQAESPGLSPSYLALLMQLLQMWRGGSR